MKSLNKFLEEQQSLFEEPSSFPPDYDPQQPNHNPTEEHMHSFINWHMENTTKDVETLRAAFHQKFPRNHHDFDRVLERCSAEY